MQTAFVVLFDILLILLLNIPFGMWRDRVKKFSFEWFCSIHLPIPYVIVIRQWSGVGFAWWTYPLFLGAFFTGQLLGKKIRQNQTTTK
ncbi:MAG: hypothetical protein ACK5IJ_03195 [Mangrovibacterium sp.]